MDPVYVSDPESKKLLREIEENTALLGSDIPDNHRTPAGLTNNNQEPFADREGDHSE